jgi:sterol desaturase/sphingolipid hydroxylase (fatty acid hydroxylase superfamily)
MRQILVGVVARATPLLVVGGALAVLALSRQQLELDDPVAVLILSWLRNALGFGRETLFFWMAGLLFLVAEYRWPARQVDRRADLHWDLANYVAAGIYIQLVALIFIALLPHQRPGFLRGTHPEWRIIMLLAATDFIAYWSHRLRHTTAFWPMHQWHHAPVNLYWLSGNRTTLADYLLLAAPSFLTFFLFALPPREALLAGLGYTVFNHWMHANVRWGHRSLEWLLVTPRFHPIHHSQSSEHFNANFGVIFTVWDRLFGTLRSPDAVGAADRVGLPGGTVAKIRMMLGV